MLKNKNIQNPAAMTEVYDLLSCPSSLAPESKLSRRLEAQHRFVQKHSHPSGKNIKNLFGFNQMRYPRIFYVFPRMRFAFRPAKPLVTRSMCESLLSGTNERGSNEGRKTADVRRGVLKVFCLTTEI